MTKYSLCYYDLGGDSELKERIFSSPEDLSVFVIENLKLICIPEVWKTVKGYEKRYKISNLGRIKSYSKLYKGKLLSPRTNKFGYIRVELYDKEHNQKRTRKEDGKYLKNNRFTAFIHRLVAEAFCPNPDPENYDEVDHIDRISDHCPFWNLRWIDRDGNRDNRKFYNSSVGESLPY